LGAPEIIDCTEFDVIRAYMDTRTYVGLRTYARTYGHEGKAKQAQL